MKQRILNFNSQATPLKKPGQAREYFWGNKNRQRTIEEFHVIPVWFYQIDPDSIVHGECGPLTQKAYRIKLVRRRDGKYGFYEVGYHAGKQLLELAGVAQPSFLDIEEKACVNAGRVEKKLTQIPREAEPVARTGLTARNTQLRIAVFIVLEALGKKEPYGLYADIINDINENPCKDICSSYIKRFNKSLETMSTTLPACFEKVKKRRPNLKSLRYSELELHVNPENNNFRNRFFPN